MYWDQLNSPEIAALDRSIPVILPIAAIEQHGHHLPLATDRMIGEHFCRELEKRISDQILILPTISVGCSEHHKEFAGSLSVQHSTMLHQMTDIADCVRHYGFKNLFVLNSHGGNQGVGQVFVETFGYRNQDMLIALASWWRIATEELKEIQTSGPGGVGHAGEFETSLMMVIAPELVDQDALTDKANIPTYDWAEGDLVVGAKVSTYRTLKEMTPTGAYGEPKLGTVDKGHAITETVVNQLEKILSEIFSS
jgi:creatinine amidohydrolase